jgi:hypothetical protein
MPDSQDHGPRISVGNSRDKDEKRIKDGNFVADLPST